MSVVSITDEVAGLTLDQARRAAGLDSTIVERPPSTHVFCRKLRLPGPWGVVSYGDIVHRSHPAVADNEEWFAPTSVGYGLGPGLDEELATRKVKLAELKVGSPLVETPAGHLARRGSYHRPKSGGRLCSPQPCRGASGRRSRSPGRVACLYDPPWRGGGQRFVTVRSQPSGCRTTAFATTRRFPIAARRGRTDGFPHRVPGLPPTLVPRVPVRR